MATASDSSRSDAPQEHLPKGDNPTQHIDRIELMKSDKVDSAPGAGKTLSDGIGLKGNTSEGVLDFGKDDPFAQSLTAPGDLTRGAKNGPKSHSKEATDDKSKGNLDSPARSEQKPADESVKLLNDTSKLNPDKSTVLFLDDFKKPSPGLRNDARDKSAVITQGTDIALNEVTTPQKPGVKKAEEQGFSHGEFSAQMAEANGYNAIRAQIGDKKPDEITNFAKPLNSIADQVDAGKLKLGKGDVVNISMGGADPSFDDVNELLRSNKDNAITPQNINNPDTQKDLLERLGKLSQDQSRHPDIQKWAGIMVDTNQAVQRLQDKGIEVIHSASNSGKDTVSLEFLKANRELASKDPASGKPDGFAADHAGVTYGNGVYPIRFKPGSEMGGSREGKYTVEGTGVKFDGEKFGNLNMQESVSMMGGKVRSEQVLKQAYDSQIGRSAPPRLNENGYLVAVAAGNSFVNIDYLQKNKERLQELKRGGQVQ